MIDIAASRTNKGLGALRVEWQELWGRDAAATPFQSPPWQFAWWRSFGNGEPILLTARRDGGLVGLLPLYMLREGAACKLLPIGIGLSDHIDALVDPDAPEAARHLLDAAARLPGWTEAWLPDLAREGHIAKAISDVRCTGQATVPAAKLTIIQAPAEPCPLLRLAGALANIVPRKTLRDLRQARGRAGREAAANIERVEGNGLEQAMDELFRLHEQRWRERGEAGVCADTRVQDFHRAAAAALQQAGMLRLYRLTIVGRAAAVYYGFAAKGCMYAYLSGFDPALPRLSLGAQIIGHAIEAARAEGLDRFDFLRGAEAYKYAWGAVDQPKLSLRLTRP